MNVVIELFTKMRNFHQTKPYNMKRIILSFSLVFATLSLFAQDCQSFYYLQANKTIEMTIVNRKGKIDGVMTYNVGDIKKDASGISSTIHSEMVNEKGKSLSKSVVNMKCDGGELKMDMTVFIPAAQQEQLGNIDATANAVYLAYPSSLSEGEKLPDGHINMDMKQNGGINSSVTMDITDRKVEGKETVTTTAGSWECYKISYKSKIVTKIAGIGIPIKIEGIEWFAPGFGIVKTSTKFGTTEITAIK